MDKRRDIEHEKNVHYSTQAALSVGAYMSAKSDVLEKMHAHEVISEKGNIDYQIKMYINTGIWSSNAILDETIFRNPHIVNKNIYETPSGIPLLVLCDGGPNCPDRKK